MILMLTLALFALQLTEVPEGWRVENDHYAVLISRVNGMISKLLFKGTGEALIENMNAYTDYGIYERRRYVGSRGSDPEVFVSQEGRGVKILSKGRLKPSLPERSIAYRTEFIFDESPEVRISCELVPNFGVEDVRAFLSLCWAIPSLSEWLISSADGWLCQERGDGRVRDFSGFLDFRRPVVLFMTRKGAHLLIDGINWETPTPPQRVVIHGRGFFLCFMDGVSSPLIKGGKYSVRFSLKVGKGIPHLSSVSALRISSSCSASERGITRVVIPHPQGKHADPDMDAEESLSG